MTKLARASSSYIELHAHSLGENIAFIQSRLNGGVALSAVIKGNAYGHGIVEFVPLAEQFGVEHFSVYGIEDAIAFASCASHSARLMIMGYIGREHLKWVLMKQYEFFVYDLEQLDVAIALAQELGIKARIHVEVETGMNRTGLDESMLEALCERLGANENCLELRGLCTHLAGSENIANHERIMVQQERFEQYDAYFRNRKIFFQRKHVACSAGVMRYPKMQYDLVRVGIMLYGFWPSREIFSEFLNGRENTKDPLMGILTWKSKVMSVKQVKPGEYIGYGTSYLANKKVSVAIVPVGYAHGYARSLSNHGRVLIHGFRVPVIGTVSMNMLAIDVSQIPEIKQDDEVVLIGTQGDNRITVASFGEMSAQLNYELLARLPHNIPRITA